MPVRLRIRDDLSMNDIIDLGKTHLVKVTPHVGNWTPARLVLPTLGISILCVDHTIGNKDPNAHPHLFIQGGEAHVLSDHDDRLTTHAYVTRPNGSGHPLGNSLSRVHVGTLRGLYPDADIMTHSEHLREQQDVTLAVLEEATRVSRSATWWRSVNEDGEVTNYRSRDLPRFWREFERSIFPLTDERKGWLVHNRIAILMDVVIQSRMGKEPEIYHLSGPDMVRYLGGEMETISRLYDHVRSRLGLPQETVTFNLVPFASFRFATRVTQAAAAEALCEELTDEEASDVVIRSCLEESTDVLAQSETKNYFTQHDMFSTGERIVVPDIAREWSMSTCASHMERLRRIVS